MTNSVGVVINLKKINLNEYEVNKNKLYFASETLKKTRQLLKRWILNKFKDK